MRRNGRVLVVLCVVLHLLHVACGYDVKSVSSLPPIHCSIQYLSEDYSSLSSPLVQYEFSLDDSGENFVFFVARGQRVADAIADFAFQDDVMEDDSLSTDFHQLYSMICTHLTETEINVCECDSPIPSRIVATIDAENGESAPVSANTKPVVIVRAGYSSDAIVHFHCLSRTCSPFSFTSLSSAVQETLRTSALETWKFTPFALLDGLHLMHLLQYRLSEMINNALMKKICRGEALYRSKVGDPSTSSRFVDSVSYICNELHSGVVFSELHHAELNTNILWTPPIDFMRQLTNFLSILDSAILPEEYMLHGLLKAVLNGYQFSTFTPNFSEEYYNLFEFPDGIYLAPSLLTHHSEQLSYLTSKAKSGSLEVWEDSSRAEFRSHSALFAYLAPFAKTADILVSAMNSNNFSDSIHQIPSFRRVLNKLIYQRPFYKGIKPLNPSRASLSLNSDESNLDSASRLQRIKDISEQYENDRVIYLDNFFTPDALEELYGYCVESTIWHSPKRSYVGSYQREGLSHPLLLEIAKEMADTFPFIGNKPLVQYWAYNFEQTMSKDGILLHMDDAQVNLNIWIVPDEANLDPSSGGLVVYTKSFKDHILNNSHRNFTFNDIQSHTVGEEFVNTDPHLKKTIPYRQNRVVIFDSTLWHMTDKLNFKKGFKNRRINLTYLFGRSNLEELPNYYSTI